MPDLGTEKLVLRSGEMCADKKRIEGRIGKETKKGGKEEGGNEKRRNKYMYYSPAIDLWNNFKDKGERS